MSKITPVIVVFSVYRHPYLYILHSSSIEVMELKPHSFRKFSGDESCEQIPETRTICLQNPNLLGFGPNLSSVILSCTKESETEVRKLVLLPCKMLMCQLDQIFFSGYRSRLGNQPFTKS
jgi:hypothetical protein